MPHLRPSGTTDARFVRANAEVEPEPTPTPAGTQEMYRLYNPNSGEHFFTSNAAERDSVKAAGWTYEGVGWVAPADGAPVYRQYNPNAFANNHNFTASLNERDTLLGLGWKDENVAWYGARVFK